MLGQLFTQEFLKTGICDSPLWRSITDTEIEAFIADLKTIYAPFKASSNLNEPMTENEILVRVLVKLGWTDILTQQIASKGRREDLPNMLLFPNLAAKSSALKERREDRRYRHGIVIVESKRWMRPPSTAEQCRGSEWRAAVWNDKASGAFARPAIGMESPAVMRGHGRVQPGRANPPAR